MISSYQSAINQLNTLNDYMSKNVIFLLLNIDLYESLINIRERLQKEIAAIERRNTQLNSKYAKILRNREIELEKIKEKRNEAMELVKYDFLNVELSEWLY